ncbi:MAG: hypothetical protein ACP5E4_01150, partial [Candidatus Aenigmatarchaeota archaeon]
MATPRELALLFLAVLFSPCLVLLFGVLPAEAVPTSYIIEKTTSSYHYNGTLIDSSNQGSVEIGLANTYDVLQNIVVTLSSLDNTNINNSEAYAAVAASPHSGDRTKLYLETNTSNSTTTYFFEQEREIWLAMEFQNEDGGIDLHPGENNVLFFISLNASQNMNGVILYFQSNRDTSGINDSMDILDCGGSTGTAQVIDSDGDGHNDRAVWTGNLWPAANITIRANITPGVHYDPDLLVVDTDSLETKV